MPIQYSKQLILETIDCFKQENGIVLSPEQANEYLNSLANLYLAFLNEDVLVDKLIGDSRGDSNTSNTLQIAT